MDGKENPQSGRGQGTAVCSDGRDPITIAARHDAQRSACAFPQRELFGLAVRWFPGPRGAR